MKFARMQGWAGPSPSLMAISTVPSSWLGPPERLSSHPALSCTLMPQTLVLKVRVSSGCSVGQGLPSSQAAVHTNIYSNVYSGTQNPSLKNREPEWGSERKTREQIKLNPQLVTCWRCLGAGREAAVWHLMLPGEFRWELDKVVHSHNPSTPEAEAGGLRVQDQPGLHIECLSSGRGWVGMGVGRCC